MSEYLNILFFIALCGTRAQAQVAWDKFCVMAMSNAVMVPTDNVIMSYAIGEVSQDNDIMMIKNNLSVLALRMFAESIELAKPA